MYSFWKGNTRSSHENVRRATEDKDKGTMYKTILDSGVLSGKASSPKRSNPFLTGPLSKATENREVAINSALNHSSRPSTRVVPQRSIAPQKPIVSTSNSQQPLTAAATGGGPSTIIQPKAQRTSPFFASQNVDRDKYQTRMTVGADANAVAGKQVETKKREAGLSQATLETFLGDSHPAKRQAIERKGQSCSQVIPSATSLGKRVTVATPRVKKAQQESEDNPSRVAVVGENISEATLFQALEKYDVLKSETLLEALLIELTNCKRMSMTLLYRSGSTNLRKHKAKRGIKSGDNTDCYGKALGLGLATEAPHVDRNAFYFLPLRANSTDGTNASRDVAETILHMDAEKVFFDCKESVRMLIDASIEARDLNTKVFELFQDPKLAAYITFPDAHDNSFPSLLQRFLDHDILPSPATPKEVVSIMIEDTRNAFRLYDVIMEKVASLDSVNQLDLDKRIAPILFSMEASGMAFDPEHVRKHKRYVSVEMKMVEEEAHKLAGRPFLLLSPKQVAEVLFEEMKLQVPANMQRAPKLDKNAKENRLDQSTSNEILMAMDHRLPQLILKYRSLAKLLSNWIEGLLERASPSQKYENVWSMRCRWLQTSTGTGRLSSVDPNMQNIPKHTVEVGNISVNIRDAFCARPGTVLLAMDYSQLEMRLLAHFSGDPSLLKIFHNGGDIHRMVASHWLKRQPHTIADHEREQAKRVCYGIIYGIGAPGLAELLKVSTREAHRFIETFLGSFPGIKSFLEKVVAYARQHLYVQTLDYRKRFLPDITSPVQSKRLYAERQAINSVIQGTAASIVKMAMVSISNEIHGGRLPNTRILLQIHDELVFEVPEEFLDIAAPKIKSIMETVANIQVPLPVSVMTGYRWGSMT